MSNRRPSRLNTAERLTLYYFLQRDIDDLLNICDSREAMTASFGPPPPEIRAVLDDQMFMVIETIFRDAVQA